MHLVRKLGLLVSLAIVAMVFTAGTASAAGVTLTPSGNYTANGSGVLNPDGLFLPTVDCDYQGTGNTDANGENGTAIAVFSNCTTATGVSCTVTNNAFSFTVTPNTPAPDNDADVLNTTDPTSVNTHLDCGSVITCTARIVTGEMNGTLVGGNPATITINGPTTDDNGFACTGNLTSNGTITNPSPLTVAG